VVKGRRRSRRQNLKFKNLRFKGGVPEGRGGLGVCDTPVLKFVIFFIIIIFFIGL
jgi:hypothetical protein